MSNEVLGTRLQSKLLIYSLHVVPVKINPYNKGQACLKHLLYGPTLMSGRVFVLPPLEELKELLCSPLLEEAH